MVPSVSKESGDVVVQPELSDTMSCDAASVEIKAQPERAIHDASQSGELAILAGPRLYAIMGALVLVVLLVALDMMIMATAIPSITDEFHTIVDIGWYVTAYMITSAALQPLTGKVYTYFNLTYSYIAFVALFEVGSVVCATAPTSVALVIGRAVAGMGASGLSNGALTIIGIAAPPAQRPQLMGILMIVMGMGQIIGPLVGGSLSQYASWRWCFWINLPLGVAAAVALLLVRVPNPNQRRGLTVKTFVRKFDIVGFLLFAPACIMLLIAFQWGGNIHAWRSATIIGLLCGAGVVFCLFIAWEWHTGDNAMFPGSLLKRRVVYSSCITTTLQFGALLVSGYYLALWFQAIKRSSPTISAVYTLPTFGLQILGVMISSVIINKIGFFTPFSVIGGCLIVLGNGLFSTFTPYVGVGKWIGFQIIVGIGRGFSMQQPFNAIQANLSGAEMSTGMAVVAWAQLFGGAVFIALAQTTFTSILQSAVRELVPSVSPADVINAGATNYLALVGDDSNAHALLLSAYNRAVTQTFYLAGGAGAFGTVTAFGMGWKRVLKAQQKPNKNSATAPETQTQQPVKV